ncbi:MAG: beta-ketoacyl synthase N-terminal-like domain-containing protein [Dermatophilaceae bacterium]
MVMTNTTTGYADSDIAIIGMTCNFPGAGNVGELWDVLRAGRETISHFTLEELVAAGVPEDRASHPDYVPAKGVIHGVENFDAEFFGFRGLEAEVMDPQQRLFLEFTWKALEEAGYDTEQFAGKVGLFAGQAFNTYLLNNLRHARETHVSKFHGIDLLVMTDKDFLTTLVAHHLGLRGPAMTVQTACSTSVVAIHQACQSLLNRECEIALAGAITVYSPQVKGYFYEPGNLISPDGHIRSFDVDGQGTVYSSGMGMVVLKPLDAALRDGDVVLAVIKGSAINNDGGRKAFFKAPSEDGIADVAAPAIAVGGVDAASVRMVEANGSGTQNGDPIEVHALTRAFREYTDESGFCAIGSVKSNIGHLNVAAGIAAVLKGALCITHGEIAPTVNFRTSNPAIRFDGSPFVVAQEHAPWPETTALRTALINSYGVGGTNGAIVLAEAPEVPGGTPDERPQVLVLSAKSPAALGRMRDQMVKHLRSQGELDLADVCYTLQVGRRAFGHRLAVVGSSLGEVIDALAVAETAGPVVGRGSAAASIGVDETADRLRDRWLAGGPVDWTAFHAGRRRMRVVLPTYAFNPARHWVDIPVAPTAHVYDAAL